jgi:hypothetical protein
MKHIILTPEQTQIVQQAGEAVEVRDEEGRTVAHLTRLAPAEIEAIDLAKRRLASDSPRIPSAQVQAHFRRLEEIRDREGMDEAKMHDLLRHMRAGEPV